VTAEQMFGALGQKKSAVYGCESPRMRMHCQKATRFISTPQFPQDWKPAHHRAGGDGMGVTANTGQL
jgi:hypothetical protein